MWTSLRGSRTERRSQLAFWFRRVLNAQRRSELSVSAVAERVGVTPATLYSWRRRIEEDEVPPQIEAPGLIRVRLRGEDAGVVKNPAAFVLRRGTERALEVPSGFDAHEFARTLEVIEAC